MQVSQQALRRLIEGIAESWTPRRRQTLAEWCAAELRLPERRGPNPGRIDFAAYPFTVGILDAAEDPETEEIVYVAATQVSKTTTLQMILAGLSQLRPAPAMLAAPDQDAIRRLRDKLYELCDESPGLKGRVPPRHLRNLDAIDFGTSVCYLAWTGNPQRVSGESCRVVLVTETDRCHRAMHEGALHKLISERVKSWFDFLKVFEGTPTDQTSTIWSLWEQSTQERWQVPCPHCGHFQPLRFWPHRDGPYLNCGGVDGLRDERGAWCSAEEARERAFYRCEQGCRIHARHKADMIARGRWSPKGCRVNAAGELEGTPARSKRRRGFHLNSLYSPVISIGRVACEYLDSRDNPAELRNFMNNWAGLRWLEETRTPKAAVLHRRLRGTHRRGTVPPKALFLTAAADCHQDNVHWIVRAWGDGCTSWLVDWGIQPRRLDEAGKWILDSHLTPLAGLLLDRDWPLLASNPLGDEALRIEKLGVDSGHEPLTVHNFCRRFHPDRVFAVAGQTAATPGVPYKFSIVEKNTRTGKSYPGGMRRWAINTSHFKNDIAQRWDAPLDEPGAWWLPDCPFDAIEDYCRQVTNEGRVPERRRKTGQVLMVWRVLQDAVGNHFFDCEVYARALAEMVVGGNWDDLSARFLEHRRAGQARPTAPPEEEGSGRSFQIRRPRGRFLRGR